MPTIRKITYLLMMVAFVPALQAQTFSTVAESERYQNCISQVEISPNITLTLARQWYAEGGGVAAQHCEALALNETGDFSGAATLFEKIVDYLTSGQGVSPFALKNKELLKVQLNYLAGNAWRDAGELDKAYNAFSASIIGLAPNSVFAYDIFLERGLIQVLRGDQLNAIEDFTRALELNQEKIDAFVYRAKAYRKIKSYTKARLDLKMALGIETNNPEALFESGAVYRLENKNDEAKAEWQKLKEKYPDTAWQKLAEDNLELMVQ